MKIEEQVITKVQAKKLYELGVEQKSLFYWNQVMYKEEETLDVEKGHWSICYREAPSGEIISAFTVSELGEMLPESVNKFEWDLNIIKDHNEQFVVAYREHISVDEIETRIIFSLGTEVQSRAEMLIYLLENKLIKNKK